MIRESWVTYRHELSPDRAERSVLYKALRRGGKQDRTRPETRDFGIERGQN